jgi:hypothetical protein
MCSTGLRVSALRLIRVWQLLNARVVVFRSPGSLIDLLEAALLLTAKVRSEASVYVWAQHGCPLGADTVAKRFFAS